jgi:hypothetical protein
MGWCSTALAFNNIGGIKNTKRGVEEVLQSYISGMNCAGKTTLSRRGMWLHKLQLILSTLGQIFKRNAKAGLNYAGVLQLDSVPLIGSSIRSHIIHERNPDFPSKVSESNLCTVQSCGRSESVIHYASSSSPRPKGIGPISRLQMPRQDSF